MADRLWIDVWRETAEAAEHKNSDLIIFEIPKTQAGASDLGAVDFIEKYIQDRANAAKAALSIFESSAPKFEQFHFLVYLKHGRRNGCA